MAGSGSRYRGDDNHGEALARLYGVAEDAWEAKIRRTLAEQAAQVRTSRVDFAGAAVARAHRVRRRRMLSLVGTAAAVVTAAGVLVSYGLPGGAPVPSYTTLFGDAHLATAEPDPDGDPLTGAVSLAADLAVSLVVATEAGEPAVVSPEGTAQTLDPVAGVVSAYRMGEGWAVVDGDPGAHGLWWVTPGSEPVPLLSDLDAIVLGDGRVAWQRGSTLSTAALTADGRLTGQADTRTPAKVELVGFAGDAVLLSQDHGARWDVWPPAGGDYRPAWTEEVARVFGVAPGGETAIGLAAPRPGDPGPCLVRLRVASGLAVTARACPDSLPDLGPGTLSPTGRWLVAAATPARRGLIAGSTVVVVDVPAVFGDRAPPAGTARMDPVAVVPLAGAPASRHHLVWSAPDEAVLATAGSLVWLAPQRVLAGEPEAIDEVPLGGSAPLLVPGPRP